METKEYKLSVKCNRVVVASIDMTEAADMMLIHQDDKSLYSMLIKAISDWIVGNKLKSLYYEPVENAALAAVEKLKDYVLLNNKYKYYSFIHLLSDDYSLFLNENDGKVFIDIIQPNWVITYNSIE